MRRRKRALLSILMMDDGPIDGPLYCPCCGGSNVHPISVTMNPPGDMKGELTVKADGLHIDKRKKRFGIGVKIIITFGCKGGHVWAIDFGYCRGQTLAGLLHPSEPVVGEYEILGRPDSL